MKFLRTTPITRSPSFPMALSVSFIRLVSSTNVTQATRLRPSTSVGLAPTEQTSLCWTHWVANSKLGPDAVFPLVTMRHARFGCSLCPSHHDRSPHRPTWRIAFGHCRIRPDQTPASDRESLPPPCAQSPRMGPTDRRLVLAVDPASPSLAISNRIQPSTLLNFHRALVQRKYRFLFSPKRRAKPGPKGPDQDLIRAVVDMKQRNPR